MPELDVHEAWTEVEGYLERIADLQGLQLHRVDGAAAAGASQDELDAFLLELRIEQCDLVSVVAAAAWVCGERARAHPVGLPAPAWATAEEIAHDRGAPVDVVEALISEALQRGLLASQPGRGMNVTAAGHAYNALATHA